MQKWEEFFNQDCYLSNRTLETIKKEVTPTFLRLKKKKYLLLIPHYRKFYRQYQKIDQLKQLHNQTYLQKKYEKTKDFLDHIKGVSLDNEQRMCVLNEEDFLLIIAGAGSGKSLTILGKISYLIEYLGYLEKEILVISFTNASSSHLKESLEKEGYHIPVLTFHKLALHILQNEEFHIASPTLLEYIVQEFYQSLIFNIPTLFVLTCQYFKIPITEYEKVLSTKKMGLFQKKITQFIHLFKANKEDENLLFQYVGKASSKKEKIFLINVIAIFKLYHIELSSSKEKDFDDIILEATRYLHQGKSILDYRYILIDEYQDTSLLRCHLIQEIVNQTQAKLMVVGDDFQSIYRFAGCNLDIFLHFSKYFSNPDILVISNTYRNSQELIDVAGNFIMKNKKQFIKKLYAKKHYQKPIKIVYYDNQKEIFLKLLQSFAEKKHILVLSRNQKDIESVLSKDIRYQENYYIYQNVSFKHMTVHQSKGLEADCVILLHMENDIMGFPNKLEEDSVFRFLYDTQNSYAYEEERRLFYVALTRTQNEIYLLTSEKKPSIFIKELLRDYPNQIEILGIK